MRGQDRNFVTKYSDEQVRRLAVAQDIAILCGCHRCGRRLVTIEETVAIVGDARVVYPQRLLVCPEEDVLKAVGTPLCGGCFRILYCDHD